MMQYLGAVEDETMVTTDKKKLITFEQYLKYEDGTNSRYELVDGELVLMPPASFLHSDIIDFIADLFRAIAFEHKLDVKVKTGDVGVRTGINSSRIPEISVIDGIVWRSMPRDASAVIEVPLLLAVEVVSPGTEQIERDYINKVTEYQNSGIAEYWIVDGCGSFEVMKSNG
ncbi:MAG: Uma2 family endonuclease [Xenococcaceae cyanobacterium MO_167.B52]|nr:Uma2 family endonuclease [Xenococcaceae cyanobacterium MO_167.B52]